MNEDNLIRILKDLFNNQRLAVLASNKQKKPYPNLIAFTCTDDLKNFIFVTLRNSNKFNNIMNNPNVSLLIDNRENLPSDFSNAIAVSVFGFAEEIKDNEELYRSIYLKKHPYLKDFVKLTDCAFLKINVKKYSIVSQFKKVQEIVI
jgi:nitroimidazol reductase NimA-like FMN-containing flavoprotein (pyridoxamine 5'-phosphate oxidase superfamily)